MIEKILQGGIDESMNKGLEFQCHDLQTVICLL